MKKIASVICAIALFAFSCFGFIGCSSPAYADEALPTLTDQSTFVLPLASYRGSFGATSTIAYYGAYAYSFSPEFVYSPYSSSSSYSAAFTFYRSTMYWQYQVKNPVSYVGYATDTDFRRYDLSSSNPVISNTLPYSPGRGWYVLTLSSTSVDFHFFRFDYISPSLSFSSANFISYYECSFKSESCEFPTGLSSPLFFVPVTATVATFSCYGYSSSTSSPVNLLFSFSFVVPDSWLGTSPIRYSPQNARVLFENYGSSFSNGYNSGYLAGHNDGYAQGEQFGYNSGFTAGSSDGYNTGYNAGIEAANTYSFLGLIGAVVDAPVKAFTGLFNFEIFGFDMAAFMLSLLTVCVLLKIVSLVL